MPAGGITLSWEADQDSVLNGWFATGEAVVSREPELTWIQFVSQSGVVDQLMRLYLAGWYNEELVNWFTGLNIEVLKGQKIYLAPRDSGLFQLFFLTASDTPAFTQLSLG